MKTNKLFSILVTLSLVIFLSSNGMSNPIKKSPYEILKKAEKKIALINKSKKHNRVSSTAAEKADFSYLRFDVNEYSTESPVEELPDNSFDYLRFDVNVFVVADESEITELPVANEFEYLRFDVNNFVESNTADLDEMPVNEFEYLRFDVNNFISTDNSATEELPLTE